MGRLRFVAKEILGWVVGIPALLVIAVVVIALLPVIALVWGFEEFFGGRD